MVDIIAQINERPQVAVIFYNAMTGQARTDLTVNVTVYDEAGTVVAGPTGTTEIGDRYVYTPGVGLLADAGLYDFKFVPTDPTNVAPVEHHVGVRVGQAWVEGAGDVAGAISDALLVNTYSEPSSAPTWPMNILAMLRWGTKLNRNKRQTTPTADRVFNDAGDTVDSEAAVTYDSGTQTLTRGEYD